jgi:hypothetical protein
MRFWATCEIVLRTPSFAEELREKRGNAYYTFENTPLQIGRIFQHNVARSNF